MEMDEGSDIVVDPIESGSDDLSNQDDGPTGD
jgi:hypothetical protein